MRLNSPNASVAVTVVAGGPGATLTTTSTTSTATATSGGVRVTGLCLLSVMSVRSSSTVSESIPLVRRGPSSRLSRLLVPAVECCISTCSPKSNTIPLPLLHVSPSLSHPWPSSGPLRSGFLHKKIPRTSVLIPSTSSGTGGTVRRSLGARVALSGALDRLVDDLDRRLGLPVRVELQVVAFTVLVSADFSHIRFAASVAR
jgi:hypothetical protein